VEAGAFTSGQDIYFRAGAFDPASPPGPYVLAHEAAHAVQQTEGRVDGRPASGGVSLSAPGDGFEAAADQSYQEELELQIPQESELLLLESD
jgi:hypothetical protein